MSSTVEHARPSGWRGGPYGLDSGTVDECGLVSSVAADGALSSGYRLCPPIRLPADPVRLPGTREHFRGRLPRMPTSQKRKRKTNKVNDSMVRRRRGGRAAKGGRLKICSRRSSQVRILAPAASSHPRPKRRAARDPIHCEEGVPFGSPGASRVEPSQAKFIFSNNAWNLGSPCARAVRGSNRKVQIGRL